MRHATQTRAGIGNQGRLAAPSRSALRLTPKPSYSGRVRLYNTQRRAVEPIQPARPRHLNIYACGPTVYRDAHVGNMRTFLLTDLISRLAHLQGWSTTVVQNITDVGHMADDTGLGGIDEGQGSGEDRILQQASREGRGALAIARHYEQNFHRDLAALNIHPADHYPRASEWIDQMIALVQSLLDANHAYIGTDGSVFFDAQSIDDYGALSGNKLDNLRPGHRFDGGVDPAKRFHADWALWKKAPSTRTQLTWETPWGVGFPGWHTECSAMSVELLGDTIDVHTGGIDLRFPHHEDERAQSNAVAGKEVVQHWVHAEHLLFDGRKMSKSAGNVILVADVVDRGLDPLALRLAFLQHRYRQQMNLTWAVIEGAQSSLERWRTKVAQWATSPSAPLPADHHGDFLQAANDDLDTPRALQVLRAVEKDGAIPDGARFEFFAWADRLLGLDLVRYVGQPAAKPRALPSEIHDLVQQRADARAAKDFATSDRIREELSALGYTVTDTADGQVVE
jgi:cysteinyl-tRNA synthetase